MNRRKIVLLDIDYTLFDTDLFKDTLFPLLADALGYGDKEAFVKLGQSLVKETQDQEGYLKPEVFLKKLVAIAKNRTSYDAIHEVFWRDDLFRHAVYLDVFPTLAALVKDPNVVLGILSTGDTETQQKKIESFRHFLSPDDIYIYPDKMTEIPQVLDRYPDDAVCLVDDSITSLAAGKEHRPAIMTIWVDKQRKYGTKTSRESYEPDYTVSMLGDIVHLVESYSLTSGL